MSLDLDWICLNKMKEALNFRTPASGFLCLFYLASPSFLKFHIPGSSAWVDLVLRKDLHRITATSQ